MGNKPRLRMGRRLRRTRMGKGSRMEKRLKVGRRTSMRKTSRTGKRLKDKNNDVTTTAPVL